MLEFFKPGLYFDFMGKTRAMAIISTVLVLASLAAVAVFGLNFGLDFAGGYEIRVMLPRPVSESEINQVIEPLGISDARVQRLGEEDSGEYLILVRRHGTLTDDQKSAILADVEALAGGADNLQDWSMAESGETLHVAFAQPVSEQQLRGVFEKRGLEIAQVTRSERDDRPDYTVQLVSISAQIQQALTQAYGLDPTSISVEFVGPQVGAQLRNQGLLAVLYSLVFLLLYIAVRFDFYFAPGAIVSLVHDVIITLGVFAVFQIEFTLSTVAGFLTLVGYSLNDTIVVYDRIRENLARLRGRELRHLVSSSLSETLSRTVLTSGGTLLVIGSLLFFVGRSLADFSVALLVGIIIGTYSSIAIAAPVYVLLREHYDRRVKSKTAPSSATAAG